MDKYDLKREYPQLYSARRQDFDFVTVPELSYLAIDGQGDPNSSTAYAEAVQALYSVSYAVKFASKKELAHDYVVGPLEGLWRADDLSVFTARDKAAWQWTMMIVQPAWITSEFVAGIREKVRVAKQLPGLDQLRHHTWEEGECVQIMHVGSYDDEAPVLARLHDEFMPTHSLAFNGDHHEIYLSDPRRTAPAKCRTILRQPVRSDAAAQI